MPGINLEFATDHIWTMEDKEGFIGLRVDCGDAGALYFTKDQALQVIAALSCHVLPGSIVHKWESKTDSTTATK